MQAKHFAAIAIIATSSAITAPAQAADRDFSERVFAAMSDTIANQGNQALRTIRAELRKNLAEAIKPLLPQPDQTETADGAASLGSSTRAIQ